MCRIYKNMFIFHSYLNWCVSRREVRFPSGKCVSRRGGAFPVGKVRFPSGRCVSRRENAFPVGMVRFPSGRCVSRWDGAFPVGKMRFPSGKVELQLGCNSNFELVTQPPILVPCWKCYPLTMSFKRLGRVVQRILKVL